MKDFVKRLTDEMDRYSESHNDDNAVPVFRPSRTDVDSLVDAYNNMSYALHASNLWLKTLSEHMDIEPENTKFTVKSKNGKFVRNLTLHQSLETNDYLLSDYDIEQ